MIVTLSKATIVKIKYVTIISLVLAILAMIVIVFATDATPPTYSLNGTNSTMAGSAVKHSLNWTDNIGLDSYIFSFDNGTGTFVNDSSAKFSYSVNGLSGWQYRKQLNIIGTTAGAQTNYQMVLYIFNSTGTDSGNKLYLGTKVQKSFNDTRFTNSTGSLLDYWIESINSTTATVWVEFDSIPASPNNGTFYIYYGNSGASSASNGTNTFIFFDHFGNLNSWTHYGHGSSSVASSIVTVSVTDATGTGRAGALDSNSEQTYPFRMRFYGKGYSSGGYANYDYRWFGTRKSHTISYANTQEAVTYRPRAADCAVFDPTLVVFGNASTVSSPEPTDNTYYVYEMILNSTNTKAGYNNQVVLTDTSHSYTNADDYLTFGANFWTDSTHLEQWFVDWVFTSKYASTEPTWGTWGSEATPTNAWSNVTKVTNSTVGSVIRWQVYANDTSTNWNSSAIYNLTTIEVTLPTFSNNQTQLVTTYTPTAYSNFSITWNDNSGSVTAYLENNFTGSLINQSMSGSYPTFTFNSTSLAAKTYQFRFVANDSANNQNATAIVYFTINRQSCNVRLWLNSGTLNADNSITYPTRANATAIINNSQSFILLRNGTSVSSGTGTLTELITLGVKAYNYTTYYTQTENYSSCSEQSILTVNDASTSYATCTGSPSSPCHYCGANNITVTVMAPNGSLSGPHIMIYNSSYGTCSSNNITNTSNYSLGYTFCPVEGTYNASINVSANGSSFAWEYSNFSTSGNPIYTINYDTDSNWCGCKAGSGKYNSTPMSWEAGTPNCCGDDTNENRVNRTCASGCSNESTDWACCDASTDCVYSATCYANGYSGDINSDGTPENCTSGTWATTAVPQSLVTIDLNATEMWWGDPVNISIQASRNSNPITNGNVNVSLNTLTGGLVCSQSSATDANGRYSCIFTAPKSIGTYDVSVDVYDPSNSETYSNSTTIKVKIAFGESETEKTGAPSIGCYEVPKIVQNPDGSIKKVMVTVCTLK